METIYETIYVGKSVDGNELFFLRADRLVGIGLNIESGETDCYYQDIPELIEKPIQFILNTFEFIVASHETIDGPQIIRIISQLSENPSLWDNIDELLDYLSV